MKICINGKYFMPIPPKKKSPRPFSQLIKDARKEAKQSLQTASRKIGTGKSYLWGLEEGLSQPTLPLLEKILSHYNLNYYEILFPSQNQNNQEGTKK